MVIAKLSIVAVILILTFILMFVLPKIAVRENFASSAQLLMKSQNNQGFLSSDSLNKFDRDVATAHGVGSLNDSNGLLLIKRCFQMPGKLPNVLQQNSVNNAYNVTFEGLFSTMVQVEDRIVQEIIKFKDIIHATSPVIKGKIYVLIYQVPYYKNERGNPINVSYYTGDILDFQPSNSRNDIFYRVSVIFANYSRSKEYLPTSVFETMDLPQMEKYASNDKQCFVRCVHSDVMCGCTSSDPGMYPDDRQYVAQCLGRASPTDKSQMTPASFLVLHVVNPSYALVSKFME